MIPCCPGEAPCPQHRRGIRIPVTGLPERCPECGAHGPFPLAADDGFGGKIRAVCPKCWLPVAAVTVDDMASRVLTPPLDRECPRCALDLVNRISPSCLHCKGSGYLITEAGREVIAFLQRHPVNLTRVTPDPHANCLHPDGGAHAIDCPDNPRYQP